MLLRQADDGSGQSGTAEASTCSVLLEMREAVVSDPEL